MTVSPLLTSWSIWKEARVKLLEKVEGGNQRQLGRCVCPQNMTWLNFYAFNQESKKIICPSYIINVLSKTNEKLHLETALENTVAHSCNPKHLGNWGRRITMNSRPTWNTWLHISTKQQSKHNLPEKTIFNSGHSLFKKDLDPPLRAWRFTVAGEDTALNVCHSAGSGSKHREASLGTNSPVSDPQTYSYLQGKSWGVGWTEVLRYPGWTEEKIDSGSYLWEGEPNCHKKQGNSLINRILGRGTRGR